MSNVTRFTDLEVWRRSHALFLDVLNKLDDFPRTRAAAALTDQVIRSLGSVGANIAEGFNRSKSRYLNALDIALGEANESENWLYKIRDAGLFSRQSAKPHIAECIEIEKMLSGLIRSIRSRP